MVRKPIKYSSEVITVRGAVGFANSPELPPRHSATNSARLAFLPRSQAACMTCVRSREPWQDCDVGAMVIAGIHGPRPPLSAFNYLRAVAC